jgi:hypothetical protein
VAPHFIAHMSRLASRFSSKQECRTRTAGFVHPPRALFEDMEFSSRVAACVRTTKDSESCFQSLVAKNSLARCRILLGLKATTPELDDVADWLWMVAALQSTPSDETYRRRCSDCATRRQLMYVCNEVVDGFGEGEKDAAWLLQCKDSAHSNSLATPQSCISSSSLDLTCT